MAGETATSVVDVIAAEAGGKTLEQRYANMKAVASTFLMRSIMTGESLESIVAGKNQFSAYGNPMPKGTSALRGLARRALEDVLANGPIDDATYYARDYALHSLPHGLRQVGVTQDNHYRFTDPKMRPIKTADGTVPLNDFSRMVRPSTVRQTDIVHPVVPSATPIAARFAETPPQPASAAWDTYVQSLREDIARHGGMWPTTTEKGPRLRAATPDVRTAPASSLPEFGPIVEFRPQVEDVPIPQPRPDQPLTDPIDTRSIRSRSASRRARAAANRRAKRADLAGPESLVAAAHAPDAGRLFSGVSGLLGASTAPRFAPTYADIAGLMAHPAYGARLQTDFPGGLTPEERIAIGNVPRPASNLDYRMAGIAASPDLNTAALDSNPTYQAPQRLETGGTLGQIGPSGLAGKPQYGGGLAEIFAAQDMARDPRAFDARVREEEVARARKADAVMAGRDLAQRDRQAVGPAPMRSTPVPPTPAADPIAAMLAGMGRLAPRPTSTLPARKAVISPDSPAGLPNAAAPVLPQAQPSIAGPTMQTPLQQPATRARLGTAPAAHRPRQRTISPLDVFPPAPPAPSGLNALGAGLPAALRSALLGGLTGGLPGAAIGFFGGLLGDQFGAGVGGLLGNNGPTGPATAGEMFNAGYGTSGIGQGMYGPRGATGWSLSNPGSSVTSRGPGQGYDLTSGKYGWREHYDENGNFRGISYADGSRGGLLGSLFGGGSGKGRKSDKDGTGKGSGKSMAAGLY